ncbi:MAG: TRAP transporter large permease [Hyphomonadaceae bacterium]|jgi:tripartite ATP-independent transporter DctM subunit|nr:TRAP transporter large permease [Hyphomonadaceae bacterium]
MSMLILSSFLVISLLGMPLAFALGVAALIALSVGGVDFNMLPQRMMHSVNAFPLMAIPLFMLAGELMIRGGLAERLIQLANAFIGRVAGGLAQVTMLAGAGMAAVSGAAVADASALATVLVRQLSKVYGVGFSAAIVAAAANLGPIIPPSNAMIVYAYMAGSSVSVAGLFLAGVVPGILLTLGMMVIIYVMAKRRGYPLTGEPLSLRHIASEMWRSWMILLMPIVVIGGIVIGAFTATEGAAVAVAYALLVGFFVTRQLKLADLPDCLLKAAITTAVVGALIAFASAVTFLVTIDLLPARLSVAIRELTSDPLVFSLLVAAMLFVVGMFLESNAAYIMLVPLFHPIALAYGLDPLHFGFLFVFNLVLGMLTPPVGVVLFVVCGVANVTMGQIMRHLWPFVAFGFGLLFMCMFYPPLVIGLPRALGY